jgi:hypothetical protein
MIYARKLIKDGFAEFNRDSVATRGRQYPVHLRELIAQGYLAGLKRQELRNLSGMSYCALDYAIRSPSLRGEKIVSKENPSAKPSDKSRRIQPRRLEIVPEDRGMAPALNPLLIRLPSGVVIELRDGSALTPSLIQALAKVEANHVASR